MEWLVGKWIRPWAGEGIVGQIAVVANGMVECHCENGETFVVRLEDVKAGKFPALEAGPVRLPSPRLQKAS